MTSQTRDDPPGRSLLATSLSTISIRGASIALRSALVLVLARVMPTEMYGVFGLLQSSVSIGLYLIGLDVYVVTTRRIPTRPLSEVSQTTFSQLVIHAGAYVTVLPVFVWVVTRSSLPEAYAVLFATLVLLEHSSFEVVRLLTALGRPVQANWLVFARSFLWIAPYLTVGWLRPGVFTIPSLLAFWIAGLVLANLLAVWLLAKEGILPMRGAQFDWREIRGIVSGAAFFLIASVSSRTVLFSGRYSLDFFATGVEVGIYSFYQNIVMLVDVFVYTAITMILLPQVLSAREAGSLQSFRRSLGLLQGGLWWGTLAPILLLIAVRRPLIAVFDKPEMVDQLGAFVAIAGVALVGGLGQVFHYQLYVTGRDRPIVVAAVVGLLSTLGAHVLLVPALGVTGAAAATGIGLLSTMGLQLYALRNDVIDLRFLAPSVLRELWTSDVRYRVHGG